MTNFIRTLFGFFIIISLTGCIEIFEDLTLEKDGSGHFREKVDMSGAASMINMLKASSDSSGENGEAAQNNDLSQAFMEKWEKLKGMPGIENVRIVRDTSNYQYSVEFDFDNGTALNDAVKKMQGKEESEESVFKISKSSLTRSDTDMSGALDQGEDEETAEMAKAMLSEMKYTISVTLPGKVKSVSNKNAEIVGTNIVKLVSSFGELTEKKKSLGMEIRYK